MEEALRAALAKKLLALADDELVLAHRDSEWTGHAPILEEDIAFANIAQDELGHAVIWLELRQALAGEAPDQMVYFRRAVAFRNVQMVELPKGDWAFSIVRQYLFDALEWVRLPALAASEYRPLAEAAAKIRPEEIYHLRHLQTWMKRLGLGTEESNRRMQSALNELWPYAQQLFAPLPHEELLVEAAIVPDPALLHADWSDVVAPLLQDCDLRLPDSGAAPARSRAEHTPHLEDLLEDLHQVAHLDSRAEW